MNAEETGTSQETGICVVVTPERDGVREQVPPALADALAHHETSIHHALSPYHAIAEVAAPGRADRVTLLIVEPDRCARADALALATMAHAPDVAVWRYIPDDESPVAPYVPDRPGVVADPLVRDDDSDDDQNTHDDHAGGSGAAFRIVGGEDEGSNGHDDADDDSPPSGPGAYFGDQPLVSGEELSMLLGPDEDRERGV